MRGEPSCPKCGGRVRAPGLFSDSWQCALHGTVHPLQPVIPPSVEGLSVVVHRARVPVWMPWPLPVGWLFTGVASAGDDRSGGRATAVACSGPGPLGGIGELLLIAEELGVGMGARFAGIDGLDPGSSINVSAPPHAKVVAAGRPTPLWHVNGGPDDRAVFMRRGAGPVALGDRLAGAVRPPAVRRARPHRPPRRGSRGRAPSVRGPEPAHPGPGQPLGGRKGTPARLS